jgi:peptidoglycan/xylan/chitin deacetylase (PgdA/CDA1 family)
VKATFFLTGVRVAAEPGLAADVVAAGHDVYGHGWDHVDYRGQDPRAAVSDMRRVEERLARLRHTPTPYLLRLPYNAGFDRSRMHRAMARFHPDVRFAWFSHNIQDYLLAEGCPSPDELVEQCRRSAQELGKDPNLPGGIILLHEAPFGSPVSLAPQVAPILLPMVLEAIRSRGLRAGLIHTSHPERTYQRFLFLARSRSTWVARAAVLAGPGSATDPSLLER